MTGSDQELMLKFAEITAAVGQSMLEYSRAGDPAKYQRFGALIAAGEATLQLRVTFGDDATTALWVLDAAGEPLGLLGTVVGRGGVTQ